MGAGCNINITTHFNDAEEFVFIDTLPRNNIEFLDIKYKEVFYNKNFVTDLIDECNKYNFCVEHSEIIDKEYYKKIMNYKYIYLSCCYNIPKHINPQLIIFFNKKKNQRIIYYISTNIKYNMNKRLKQDIMNSNGIIINETFPTLNLLNYFDKPKTIFAYTGLLYKNENDTYKTDTFLHFINNCICSHDCHFNKFVMVYKYTGNKKEYNNLLELINGLNKYHKLITGKERNFSSNDY